MHQFYWPISAIKVTPNMSIDDFNSAVKDVNVSGVILGFSFWAARIIGICIIGWGVYYYVTAWQSHDGADLVPGTLRVFLGGVLLSLPFIFSKAGLVVIS